MLIGPDTSVAVSTLACEVWRNNVQCRFMAEVPNAHATRLQTLLGWLVQCQGGAALPFLLPGLLLCSQPDADSLELAEPGTHRSWQQALLQPEASDALNC